MYEKNWEKEDGWHELCLSIGRPDALMWLVLLLLLLKWKTCPSRLANVNSDCSCCCNARGDVVEGPR